MFDMIFLAFWTMHSLNFLLISVFGVYTSEKEKGWVIPKIVLLLVSEAVAVLLIWIGGPVLRFNGLTLEQIGFSILIGLV